jgi:hypothetical protein
MSPNTFCALLGPRPCDLEPLVRVQAVQVLWLTVRDVLRDEESGEGWAHQSIEIRLLL